MENWIMILIIAVAILVAYLILFKVTSKKKLHTLTEEHNVSEPHSNLNSLKTFIENCWGQGFSIPEIKEILMEKGWGENIINKMFYKSSIPNEEINITRLQRTFNLKPKDKEMSEDIKVSGGIPDMNAYEEPKIDISEGTDTTPDDYKESDEVTRLKREILKDLKEEKN